MYDIDDLYQDVVLDHSRRPRNFKPIEDADRTQEGFNPLCGDRITVYMTLDGEVISDVSFEGSGCAISKASASMMTESIKGKSRAEAEEIFGSFRAMITREAGVGSGPGAPGRSGNIGKRVGLPNTHQVRDALVAHDARGARQGRRDGFDGELAGPV